MPDDPVPHAAALQPGEGRTLRAQGVTITFKTPPEGAAWSLFEYEAPPRFPGPPPHLHKTTTEGFYVLEGTLTLELNGETHAAPPGSYVHIPPGTPHGFANPGDTPAKFLVLVSRPGFERFFEELVELARQEPTWPPEDRSNLSALYAKYDTFPSS